ncbi:hypothetical protein DL769_011577 [Monosporascus sp. CRB-8-3]|nr:hypothetical protein DL769_011577 [Monosporascus sp. CRB-8-3]
MTVSNYGPSIHRQNHHFSPLAITPLKIPCLSYFTSSLTFASGAGLAFSSAAGHPIYRLHQLPLGWYSNAPGSSLGRASRRSRGILVAIFDEGRRKFVINLRSRVIDLRRGSRQRHKGAGLSDVELWAKAEADHQERRVEWVQSEISKIAAEQKTAGKSSSSVGTKSRKRKPTDDATDDADVEPRVVKHRRTDETEKMVVGKSDNSRTTRSRKRKLPTDEDTREPQLKTETKVAGETDCSGARSRKRRKAIHEQHGSEDPSSVLEPSLGTAVVSVQDSSTVTSNSRPRRQAKRISRGTAAVGSRDERLKTLRPRVDGKVAVVRGLKTRGGEAARKARGRPRSIHSRPKVT